MNVVTRNNTTYADVEFYESSEDWMFYSLEYTVVGDKTTRYGLSGIDVRPITPNVVHVYYIDINDPDFTEHFLFRYDDTEHDCPMYYMDEGCVSYQEDFVWMLCDAIERHFA